MKGDRGVEGLAVHRDLEVNKAVRVVLELRVPVVNVVAMDRKVIEHLNYHLECL